MVFITATEKKLGHPGSMIVYQNYTNPTQTPKKAEAEAPLPDPFCEDAIAAILRLDKETRNTAPEQMSHMLMQTRGRLV